MKIIRNLKITQKTLVCHKMRTILALLGIIVGVSAVIIMVSIGNGARQKVISKINAMGTHLIIVNAGDIRTFAGRQQIRGKATTLTPQDAKIIKQQFTTVTAIATIQSKQMQVKAGSFSSQTTIVGTTPNFTDVRNFKTEKGWFFSDEDNRVSRRQAVLGWGVAQNLFFNHDPLGEIIRIGRIPFRVIGVMEPKGVDMYGTDQDDRIFIPINTALRRVFNQDHIEAIYIQVDHQENIHSTTMEIKKLLRQRHRLNTSAKPDDFTIQSQINLIKAQKETSNTFTTLTASIAGISLVVGGIGILAVMLLSIRERLGEVGLRMAVGARRRDVHLQFLFEATILSIVGGIIGIVLGITFSLFFDWVLAWDISISLLSIGLSFGFSLLIGVFFGVYPAYKASRLDPIEALRRK